MLCGVPGFAHPLIGFPIDLADRLIGSPVAPHSTESRPPVHGASAPQIGGIPRALDPKTWNTDASRLVGGPVHRDSLPPAGHTEGGGLGIVAAGQPAVGAARVPAAADRAVGAPSRVLRSPEPSTDV